MDGVKYALGTATESLLTNCYLWATEQRREQGGRVFYRWTTHHRAFFFRWLHALYLPPEHEPLVETRFRFQRYWAIGRSHWRGIPFPRLYWLSVENACYLKQAVPVESLGDLWIPPLMFRAMVKTGD
jgi:hypothetical protein